MTEDTIQLGTEEFPLKDTLVAAKALRERTDAPQYEAECAGNVMVEGDGYCDNDVRVRCDGAERSIRYDLDELIEKCEDAKKPSFVEYVRENVFKYGHEIVEEKTGGADIIDTGGSNTFNAETYEDIVNDEGINLDGTTVNGDGNAVIRLFDDRE